MVRLSDALPTLELPQPKTRNCRDCGEEFTARFAPQTVCPRCVDEHVRLTADDLCRKRADEWIARLRRAGIAGRLAAMRLDTFAPSYQPDGWRAIGNLLKSWPDAQSVVLLGPPGTGKTHLAVGAVLALLERGIGAHYVHVPTVVAELRRAEDQREAERRYLDPVFAAPLVVLDDVGREKPTEHWQQWLDVLVNDRWLQDEPVILTTNLDERRLVEWLGAAAASRLLSVAQIVRMQPGDHRQRPTARITPPAAASGDPTKPCVTCAGAGWVLDEGVPVGRRERLMQCVACSGRGY